MTTWVVEIDMGAINWVPIAYCVSEIQAEKLAARPHIVSCGKPARVRELWKPAPQSDAAGQPPR